MAMVQRFFTGKADANLAGRGKIQSGDMFISKFEQECVATWDSATHKFTLPATVTAFADDAYNSGLMRNLYVYDDNPKVAWVKIDDTDGTARTITIDESDLLLIGDGVTTAKLTNGNSYNIQILTPTATTYDYSGEYGSFAGYVELSVNITPEFAKLPYGVPAKTVWKDQIGSAVELTGNTKMVVDADSLQAFLLMVLYGKQTGQKSYGLPSNIGASKSYRVTVVGRDRGGVLGVDFWHRCQFEPAGEMAYFNNEYKTIPFRADVLTNDFFPETSADYGMSFKEIEGS